MCDYINRRDTMKKNSNLFAYLFVLILTILFIGFGRSQAQFTPTEAYEDDYYQAKIESIDDVKTESLSIEGLPESFEVTTVEFSAKILSGARKGEVIKVTQKIDDMMLTKQVEVKENEKVVLHRQFQVDGEVSYIFIDHLRSDGLVYLIVFFLVLIVIFGRMKGVNTVISLAATCLILFSVYIPAIINGYNVYIITSLVSAYLIFINLILINGFSKKTWCAIIGNVGGVIAAALITKFMTSQLMLTGFVDSESGLLLNVRPDAPLDLIAIAWASVVIGSLGAIMDIAMTIASALQEVSDNVVERNFKLLFKSGMNIGRDAVGTMTNTLILAYIGSSLATVLLLISSNKNLTLLFNLEMIAMEVLQGVVGSIGILLAIPLTSVISAYLYSKD